MSKLGESLLKGAKEALAYAKNEKIKAKMHKIKILSENGGVKPDPASGA
ncbi:MAG: hypothetical protein P4M12_02235 [Gammaproteobacteria bacterium]|nr:hypothetical protein [Gammaproteobacteria bacterium]